MKPQGGFDFTGTIEMTINYAEAYLKRQAAVDPDGYELSVWRSSTAALDYLERHLQENPGDLELQTAVAIISWSKSRQKGQQLVEHIVRANPSYAVGHCLLAIFALREKDMSGYGRHFEDAIQADPTYVPAYNSLALFYAQTENIDAALRILTQGIARFPNEASFFYNQAYIHASQEHWEAAQVSLQNAVAR
jgi:tetratricopeptide (TPR) repeat protein